MFSTSALLLLSLTTTAGVVPDPACDALRALIAPLDPRGPAVAGAVIRSGHVVCEQVAGRVTLAEVSPSVDRTTPFYLASLAKPMTAAAVTRLAAEDRLSLDDSVRMHVPELPKAYAQVTLRDLLRHESGVADHFAHLPPEEIRGLTNDAVVAFVRDRTDLEFVPGERWSYSNSGYVLLAEVVERLTGREFDDWLGETMFAPLGMTATTAGGPPAGGVVAYQPADDGSWTATPVEPRTVGPGGVWASLGDLERWVLALRRGEVFPPEFLVQALAPTKTASGKLTPFTIGFQVEDLEPNLYYAGAFGNLGGTRNVFMWLPERDAALILLSARPDLKHQPVIEAMKSHRPR